MVRWRAAPLAALLSMLLLTTAVTAGAAPAQEPESTSTSTSSTTSTLPGDTTSTTVAPPPENPPTTVPPVVDPAADADAPSDEVPLVDKVVPPREPVIAADETEAAVVAHPGQVVRVSALTARTEAVRSQAALDAATARRADLETRLVAAERTVARLGPAARKASRALEGAQELLETRAAEAYVRGGLTSADRLLVADSPGELSARQTLLGSVLEADEDVIDRYRAARAQVSDDQARAARAIVALRNELAAAVVAEDEARFWAETAELELRVTAAGSDLVIHGFRFPVASPHNFTDSFGAPRMLGTQYAHFHEGTDIFGPAGADLYAAERGVVTRVGRDVLGGIKLWIKGESGTYYYYAHLSGYAPGMTEGLVVDAGTVVGYVGDTGNAQGTSPHLHFEVHPGGAGAINPYPLLVAADEPPPPAG